MELWKLVQERGGPIGIAPVLLRELGIVGGAQGIWIDKARTGKLTPNGEGLTVAVLHTGSSYADDLAEDCVIYHYPRTRRRGSHDISEINATKATHQFELPIFVVAYPTPNSSVRDLRLGWVESWDDESRTFLISFGEEKPARQSAETIENTPFLMCTPDEALVKRSVKARLGQQRFKFRVFQRYGPKCAVCEMEVTELLDAAHIRPKLCDGSDDPRNGIVLCTNHHRAFDAGLFAIEPTTLAVHYRTVGPAKESLGISVSSIVHLQRRPHVDALAWRWEERNTYIEEIG